MLVDLGKRISGERRAPSGESSDEVLLGEALAFRSSGGVNNGSNDSGSTPAAAGTNNYRVGGGADAVTACLDSKRQKVVPLGEYYHSDSCTLCLCSNTDTMCKQISCAPPENCDGYLKKEPMHCCDICVPAVVVERPSDPSSLNMKLGAMTVALFLVISLVLFTLHRMRRKRLMVTIRRLQVLRRHETCGAGASSADDRRNSIMIGGEGDLFSTTSAADAAARIFVASDHAAAIISERPPPPYSAAVTLPRAEGTLSWAPPRLSAPAEPPPAYNAATIRRGRGGHHHRHRRSLSSGDGGSVANLSRQQQHSRTSDYPDDDLEDGDLEARTTTSSATTSSSSSSSSSTASSLSSSRESLNVAIDDDDVDYCPCSQCDSGLSEERCSLSSNDVRPRPHSIYHAPFHHGGRFGQQEQQLLQQQEQPSSSTSAAVNDCQQQRHQGSRNGGENATNSYSDGQKLSGGKLCKKKFKKLMLKAKKKKNAGRTREGDHGGTILAWDTAAVEEAPADVACSSSSSHSPGISGSTAAGSNVVVEAETTTSA